MTTVTVTLPFELTREHMLLLKAAERFLPEPSLDRLAPEAYVSLLACFAVWREPDEVFVTLTPLGRAILDQCPLLWDEAELDAKLREMVR